MDIINLSQVNDILFSLTLYICFTVSDNLVHDMQNQMRTNELHVDLLRKQNSSLENFLLATEERHNELRNQSKQEQSHHRYSYANEIVTPVCYQFRLSDQIFI